MNAEKTYALILAGGIGSRFWPLSRENNPKQFQDILGTGRSLIQSAFDRFAAFLPASNIYVITNASYVDLVKEHLPSLDEGQIMAEPFGRNTAACVAYGAHKISDLDQDATMIVAPSDHLILDEANFRDQISTAVEFAENGNVLVTLGIKPHRPDTGYGYIQYEERSMDHEIHKVVTFTEKPPLEMAHKFIESGDFLWNSGMFVWSISSILEALELHMEEMNLIFNEGSGAYNTRVEAQQIQRIYERLNPISIDNGLLEKADNVYVLPSEFGWSDLGTWKSVADNMEPVNGNKILRGEVRAIQSTDNLVSAPKDKLVLLSGVEGLYIIDTPDALLICTNDQEQEIKKIASLVKREYNDKYS